MNKFDIQQSSMQYLLYHILFKKKQQQQQNEEKSVQFKYGSFIFSLLCFSNNLKITIIKFNYLWGNYNFIINTS